MFCSPRQRASYEANQCLKRAPDFAAIDDATCGRVASELPVASALLIWRVIAQEWSFNTSTTLPDGSKASASEDINLPSAAEILRLAIGKHSDHNDA